MTVSTSGPILEDLDADGALPGDDQRVVERVKECEILLGHQPLRFDLGFVLRPPDDTDLCAEGLDRLSLVGGHEFRHAHDRSRPRAARRVRHGPAVVPGRDGDDAPLSHRVPARANEVRRAPQLECTGVLRRLQLERNSGGSKRGQRRRIDERGAANPRRDPGTGDVQIAQRDAFAKRHASPTPSHRGVRQGLSGAL